MFLNIILRPIILIVVLIEFILKLATKASTFVIGLFINILLICMFIALCTQQWIPLGILLLVLLIGIAFVYGNATVLYLISEAKEYIRGLI